MSLTDLSYYIRKYLPFVLLFLIIFLIFYYAMKLFFLYQLMSKPKSIVINPIFNKITKPILQDKVSANVDKLSYTLDTIEGTPQTATSTAKIFFLPPAPSLLGYREKIHVMAKAFGFDTEKIKYQLNDKTAVFSDDSQEMSIDIANYNFTYNYKNASDPATFENAIIPEEKEIETKAINFLTSVDRYPQELAQGKTNLSYLSFDTVSREIIPSEVNQANMVEIEFYRPDIDTYRVVPPRFFHSQNYIVMVFDPDGFKVLKAQVKFFEKSEEQVGIYPVKTGDIAWQELNTGKAYIISVPSDKQNITIKQMFLGYLDQDIYQDYLQPVYVFLGEGKFVAYVPAVVSEYFEE